MLYIIIYNLIYNFLCGKIILITNIFKITYQKNKDHKYPAIRIPKNHSILKEERVKVISDGVIVIVPLNFSIDEIKKSLTQIMENLK